MLVLDAWSNQIILPEKSLCPQTECSMAKQFFLRHLRQLYRMALTLLSP